MTTRIVIFDVGNAACGVVSCPNGYSLMVDCGSHGEKPCPAELIKDDYKEWLGLKPFVKSNGNSHLLTLLHITHPDDDHVRNAKKIKNILPPYLLHRRRHEEFPLEESVHDDYKKHIDLEYRGDPVDFDLWGFETDTFKIPMKKILGDEELKKKVKNNSSILRLVEYKGKRLLFGGDLETTGWDWLSQNDPKFIQSMKKGIDIFITPHHGHKSAFPTSLFDLTGKVKISILSKGGEANIDGTDVSSQYSGYSEGISYENLNDNNRYHADGTLTTRSNGNIFLEIDSFGEISAFTHKASPNHSRL